MLTIRITNDGEGTNESANYRYFVFVNQKEIERGAIQGHNRNDGWAALVQAIAERHLTPLAPDKWESAPSTGIVPPLSLSTSQSESTPPTCG